MKEFDYVLLFLLLVALVIWLEQRRTPTIIVLFVKSEPFSTAPPKAAIQTAGKPARKLDFAYA